MKVNQISVIIVALTLLTGTLVPLVQAVSPETNPPNTPDPPGTSDSGKSLRVNRTDIIPDQFMYNLNGCVPQLFQFQNMVMELNCSRNMTMNVTSEEGVRIQHLSMNIMTERNMYLEVHAQGLPPEDIPEPETGINRYMSFETNSTDPFNATLRYYMNSTELEMEMTRELNMSMMTWCYWNGSDWEPVMSRLTETGFLEANTTHFSLWTIMEQSTPKESGQQDVPEAPERIRSFDYTNMVPQGFQHQIERNQATMLQFSNSAMYLNCTNQMQITVSAENQYKQKMLKLEVDSGNALKLEIQLRESKPTAVEAPEKHLGFYCEIEPNTTITQARLGMEIDPVQVQAMNMETEKLSWAYWNGAEWETVDSTLTDENILEAETTHFSTWTILQVEETATEPEPDTETSTGIPLPSLFIAVGVASATLFTVKKKTRGISG